MQGVLYSLFTLALLWVTLATPAHALECANVGTAWVTQPDDTGDNGATACGEGAVAEGNDSTAVGRSALSAGDFSIALGYDASSIGVGSIALGPANSADGEASIALGSGASSAGNFSTSLGSSATSASDFSTALGHAASSVGGSSTAVGYLSTSGGINSTALGRAASSAGTNSVALGVSASSAGISSNALGVFAASAGNFSTAVGHRAAAPNPDTIVLGEIPDVNGGSNYTPVAMGTTAPLAPLHVFRDDGTAQVLVEETSMDPVPRTLFRLASAGSNAKFEIDNTLAGVNWAFTNSGNDFRISRQGSGIIEFRVFNNGDAFVAGDLEVGGDLFTNVLLPSDENLKQNVETVDPETVLEKVAALHVTAWEYRDRPGERHIGPMAQDFRNAFGLGRDEKSISTVDASGVALASIQALNTKLETRNRELEAKNAELEERLALVEALVTQLLPQTAQN